MPGMRVYLSDWCEVRPTGDPSELPLSGRWSASSSSHLIASRHASRQPSLAHPSSSPAAHSLPLPTWQLTRGPEIGGAHTHTESADEIAGDERRQEKGAIDEKGGLLVQRISTRKMCMFHAGCVRQHLHLLASFSRPVITSLPASRERREKAATLDF